MNDFPHKGNTSQKNNTFPQINLLVTFYCICANLRLKSRTIKGRQLINYELRFRDKDNNSDDDSYLLMKVKTNQTVILTGK
jgi:hypothetical protein